MQSRPGDPPPVFLDQSGRRRRLTVLAGTGIGVGLLASLGLIVAGLLTGSSVPLPGWPDDEVQRPVEAGVEKLGSSPSPSTPTTSPGLSASPSVGPSLTGAPTTTPPRPSARPSQSELPGLGDERRNPNGKPSKSPGRPH